MLGARFYTVLVCTILWLLFSPSDNARSRILYSVGMYHSLAGCCHRQVTMIGAWFYTVLLCSMLCLLSSPSDNDRSMVLYSVGMYHAPAVVFA